jgi:hypothetical protein
LTGHPSVLTKLAETFEKAQDIWTIAFVANLQPFARILYLTFAASESQDFCGKTDG